MEFKSKFKIGDVVCLKSDGTPMTIQDGPGCNKKTGGPEDTWLCVWLDADKHSCRDWFRAECLRMF